MHTFRRRRLASQRFFFSSSEPVVTIHCLAALDLRSGVEQPFDCVIVQNRQTVQSMGRWMGWTLEDNLSTVCSSAQHSQVAEEDIPHLCKQERKGPTPVRRQLSRTHAVLRRVIPGEWLPVSGMKVRSLAGLYLSNRSTFYR